MMKYRGTALVEESILEALIPVAPRKVDQEWAKIGGSKFGAQDHFSEDGIGTREDWMIRAEDDWHGLANWHWASDMLDQSRRRSSPLVYPRR